MSIGMREGCGGCDTLSQADELCNEIASPSLMSHCGLYQEGSPTAVSTSYRAKL